MSPIAGATMRSREYYGTARENVFWILVVFGAPALALYGLRAYPWLEDDAAFMIRLIAGAYAISLVAVVAARRRLFPWGSKISWFEWFAILTLPVVGAMYLVGAFLVLNGLLDRGAARDTRYVVIRRLNATDFRIVPLDRLQTPPSVLWTRRAVPELNVDSVVSVAVRPGALGHPWVGGYRVVAPDYRRVLENERR